MTDMKLWLLTPQQKCRFTIAVVAAETSSEARRIHPDGMSGNPDDWVAPEMVTAWDIGVASPGHEQGSVICAARP